MQIRATAAVVALALLGVGGCRDPATATKGPTPRSPLEVYVAGCKELTSARTCALVPPATLTLWVKTATTPKAFLGEQQIELDAEAVRRGYRLRVSIARAPAVLGIRTTEPTGAWSIPLVRYQEDPRLTAANALRRKGRFKAAQDDLAPLLKADALPLRAKAHSVQARAAFAAGDIETASAAYAQSIVLRKQAGSVSGEVHDRLALSFLLSHLGDFAGVARTLEPIEDYDAIYPSGVRQADFYRMYAATGTHDHRRAFTLGLRALAHSERMADVRLWRAVAERLVRTLSQLGRYDEARDLLDDFVQRIPPHPACVRAPALEVAGGLSMQLAQSPVDLETARMHLAEAISIYESNCKMKRRYAHTLGLMGHLAFRSHDYASAQRWLDRSIDADPSHGMSRRLRQMQLGTELALEHGRFGDAEDAFQRLALFAKLYGLKTVERRAQVGLGRAYEAQGDYDAAIDAYRVAENTLEQLSFQAPLGAGRESFLRIESTGAPRLIDLLLRRNRMDEAAAVARRSRARALRAIVGAARLEGAPSDVRRRWYELTSAYMRKRSERPATASMDDWMLSVEQLQRRVEARAERAEAIRQMLDEALSGLGASLSEQATFLAPADDEAFLVYHRLPSGWVGFAVTTEQTVARRLGKIEPNLDPSDLADRLLAPFGRILEKKPRLRLMPNGILNTVDIHALPWKGRPLVASRAVSYGLDLGVSDNAEFGPSGRAVVIDPNPELTATQLEASTAATALKKTGWHVRRLSGDAARPSRIASAVGFRATDLLHYAGHAQYGGLDGWESYLGRSSASLLGVLDILTLPAVPKGVVLSGCETAAEAGQQGASGLGLAQAFVVSGSQWVVASVRRIRDTHAYAVTKLLYEEQRRRQTWDVAGLLARVQTRLDASGSDVDWASFRVLVP